MMMVIMLGVFIYTVGLMTFLFNRKHLLLILLCLELMMLGLFFLLMMNMFMEMYEMMIFFMVLVVCEACLGLSLMVVMVFFYGSDLMENYIFMNS